MSQMTNEINKVTGTIISMAGRLIVYAIILLVLVEGVTRGYSFGHEIFCSTAMEKAPGHDVSVTVSSGMEDSEVLAVLKNQKLIRNELVVYVQKKFYDYKIYPGTYHLNTSMTSKEILQVMNEKPEESETEKEIKSEKQETATKPEETKPEATKPEETQTKEDLPEIEITISERNSAVQLSGNNGGKI